MFDSTGHPIEATDVKIPKNGKEARRSKHVDQWYAEQLKEMDAPQEKYWTRSHLLTSRPTHKKFEPCGFGFVKADQYGYVTRFKA